MDEKAEESNTDGNPNTKTADTPIDPYDPSYLKAAYAAVPEIGAGWRWYDLPYRAIRFVIDSRLGSNFPRRARAALFSALNYFAPWNELERDRAWSLNDDMHNLIVPEDEHVHIPAIWVAEFFPPSELANLKRAIAQNEWDAARIRYGTREANQEILDQSRKGGGWSWWQLGSVVNFTANLMDPDAQKRKLPKEFDRIELFAMQVGTSLTVVIGRFDLSDEAQMSVDQVWHARHQPRLVRGSGLPRSEDRLWAGMATTQEARRRLHDLARRWMSRSCPGSFAHGSAGQPLLDLVLLEQLDPSGDEEPNRRMGDPLRAIGISRFDVYRVASPHLPGLLLEAVDGSLCRYMDYRNKWTLWGQIGKAASIHNALSYGDKPQNAVRNFADDRIRDIFGLLAISSFLQEQKAKHAILRDNARVQHGKFRAQDLERLRNSFLTSSLDLRSIALDIKLNTRKSKHEGGATFFRSLEPWVAAADAKRGSNVEPANVNEELRRQQAVKTRELIAFDRDYRDVLSTAASIGTSIDAFRVQRTAIRISLTSLAVALITLVASVAGADKSVNFLRSIRDLCIHLLRLASG